MSGAVRDRAPAAEPTSGPPTGSPSEPPTAPPLEARGQGSGGGDRLKLTLDGEAKALLAHSGATLEQLGRAERIQRRMESPIPLGDILVQLGMITQDDLDRVAQRRMAEMSVADLLVEAEELSADGLATYQEATQRTPHPSDREILVDGGLVGEEAYLKAVGAKLDIPFVKPQIGEVDARFLKMVSIAYLIRNVVLPVREEDGAVLVLTAAPEDDAHVVELERSFGMPVRRACATTRRITEALRTLERLRGKPVDGVKVQYRDIGQAPSGGVETGQEAVQLVDYLLSRAVELGASDLHIEPSLSRIRVRVRVDGVLQELTDIPVDFTARLTARIKILAGMDVTEKRLHQDGKIHVRIDGKGIHVRVSTYVSTYGETVVMRILDRDRGIPSVDDIGFQPRVFSSLTDVVLRSSSGLVLLVGPTGSGKTTTLYSFVDHANDPTEKVITCEEPVEYVVDGIIQCSVNSATGPTFPDSLRAIVRQDPDTIVVGEIRDRTTAGLAVESALTGHKVYSTFHTEEAVGAFVRLLEMGVEPFLVGSTISAVIAQRLLRRLCPECKRPTRPTAAETRFLGAEAADIEGVTLYGPGECDACEGTGYRGRLAIHEVLVPGDDFRDAVLRQAGSSELRKLARELPEFLTMQEDGLLKAVAGQTSVAEIIENAPRDTGARPLSVLKDISRAGRGT